MVAYKPLLLHFHKKYKNRARTPRSMYDNEFSDLFIRLNGRPPTKKDLELVVAQIQAAKKSSTRDLTNFDAAIHAHLELNELPPSYAAEIIGNAGFYRLHAATFTENVRDYAMERFQALVAECEAKMADRTLEGSSLGAIDQAAA